MRIGGTNHDATKSIADVGSLNIGDTAPLEKFAAPLLAKSHGLPDQRSQETITRVMYLITPIRTTR